MCMEFASTVEAMEGDVDIQSVQNMVIRNFILTPNTALICSSKVVVITWLYFVLLYGMLHERAVCGKQILCSDWLPERARWSDTAHPGLPRFVPANKISPKFKRVHKSFLSQNIFCDSKKIFCDLLVGMELEKEKTETRYYFCT